MKDFKEWIFKVTMSGSVEEMREALTGFSQQRWSIEAKSVMSATYTPILLKMIQGMNADEQKYTLLEEFAALCWRPSA